MANPLDLLKDLAAKFAGIEGALAKITAAEDRAKDLQNQLDAATAGASALVKNLEDERKAHAETKAALEKAQAEVGTLQAAVETEKQRANETIASQGLTPEQLPAGSVGGGEPKGSAWKQYQALLATNPTAAGAFYVANAEAILQSRPK